ncbi:hypothetical protein [Seonamhaeicola sp. ML3]|uniref:hypothetical protein n=1 Tax=Seonamhaeicola sp. ML3 TaxID=2937786 RepID=UPI00200DC76C|nr:hypothetical protein [Seonamhaeicola sp. ML3]
MYKSKVLVSLVIVIYVLFAIFGFAGNEDVAFTLDSLILPVIALIYFAFFKKKTVFFTLFLLFYSCSDLLGLIIGHLPEASTATIVFELDYYIGNSLYVLSYIFLFIEICKSLNLSHILKNFTVHIIVLLGLNVWLVYVLQSIVHSNYIMKSQIYLELTYNIVMLVLLSGSLLNYFYRDNQKALYLFLGALCIVFSEVIDVAYIYISHRSLLNFLSTTLALVAFYFFCSQTSFSNKKQEEIQMA